ncbi:MAG: ATPase [Parcubacteria group bacterium GW2011_GWC1_43_11b]|nr:MAG: ATPase [Parcubacteria group bacterium GW2011_GWC1_43_11b]
MITDAKLDFWIANNYNVLLVGEHGVGKTTIVKEAFERNHLKWKYFSAATMDPWVDFIGVPKEQKDSEGKSFLDIVRPLSFRDDIVEALFFDEYNRAPKKVKNAVMELIQFKSINGHRFKNLRIVWAAINPDDSTEAEYDVEKLDPAQKDRFQIQVTVPFTPNLGYFTQKYGIDVAKNAIDWWKNLEQKVKILVSPRRLDYALQAWTAQGDIRDVLPNEVNVTTLLGLLNGKKDFKKLLEGLYAAKDIKGAKTIIRENLSEITPIITKSIPLSKFFIPLFPQEVAAKLGEETGFIKDIIKRYQPGDSNFMGKSPAAASEKRYRCPECRRTYKTYMRCSHHLFKHHQTTKFSGNDIMAVEKI